MMATMATSKHHTAHARPVMGSATLLGTMLLAACVAGGCARPLLSPADERTPFDRFDGLRGQHAPQYTEDEFGREKPNLRGRLGQKS
jgi:hypothetical protein